MGEMEADMDSYNEGAVADRAGADMVIDDAVEEMVRVGRYRDIPERDGPHVAAALIHRMIPAIGELEQRGWTRDRIVSRLQPARRVYAESPFVKRLQDWPRGYPGDFETVEYLLLQRNHAAPGRLSYWLEQYALDSPIAQQHRNKVDHQARAVLDTILASPHRGDAPRTLVLAAGGSPDLRQIQSVVAAQRFHVVLLDQDADALAFSAARLPLIRDRVTLVQRNVVRGLQDVRRYGPFHLVLAGGLFDYLPDRVAVMLLRYAREYLMAPAGRMLFTNIGATNPYRPWIEYLGDWRLIHRSGDACRALCVAAGFEPAHVSIEAERTGLALIVEVRKAGTA